MKIKKEELVGEQLSENTQSNDECENLKTLNEVLKLLIPLSKIEQIKILRTASIFLRDGNELY